MSHDYHRGPRDAILYDGCAECDARAADPMDGLLRLDIETFVEFWERMRAVEYGDGPFGSGHESYRSTNEAKVGKHLYYISLLLQRHPILGARP